MGEGLIVRSLSGFYTVADGSEFIECRARGKLKLDGVPPLVGDRVAYSRNAGGKGMLESLLPRKNSFIRPAVANIDLFVIVLSSVPPVSDYTLVDRMIASAEKHGCRVLLVENKLDLAPDSHRFDLYEEAGFDRIRTSAVTGEGLEALLSRLSGVTAAFAGNSGVGKSSLLNAIDPTLFLSTAEVSEKLGRGKHTTRHVELFPLPGGGRLADTPGFGSFDLQETEPEFFKEEVQLCFREFEPYRNRCRYLDCYHLKEPDCAVREAVEAKKIALSRYRSYCSLCGSAPRTPEHKIKQD